MFEVHFSRAYRPHFQLKAGADWREIEFFVPPNMDTMEALALINLAKVYFPEVTITPLHLQRHSPSVVETTAPKEAKIIPSQRLKSLTEDALSVVDTTSHPDFSDSRPAARAKSHNFIQHTLLRHEYLNYDELEAIRLALAVHASNRIQVE